MIKKLFFFVFVLAASFNAAAQSCTVSNVAGRSQCWISCDCDPGHHATASCSPDYEGTCCYYAWNYTTGTNCQVSASCQSCSYLDEPYGEPVDDAPVEQCTASITPIVGGGCNVSITCQCYDGTQQIGRAHV